MNETLHTPWGTANINQKGYYRITSYNKGCHGKLLHKLLFEEYYKCTVLPNAVIHHKDEDKLNNEINNLELMLSSTHSKIHHKNKTVQMESKLKMSLHNNISGYYRVSKHIRKDVTQGFRWMYWWVEDGKKHAIGSVDITKLEKKVKSRGLPWFKLSEMEELN